MRDPVVLFDLDGTLTDSEVGIVRGMVQGFAAVGAPPPPPDEIRRLIGPPMEDAFLAHGLGPELCGAAVTAARAYYDEKGLYENAVYEGIEPLLAGLAERGFILGVATSKRENVAVRVLEHLGLAAHFAVVRGATEDGTRRHKHEVIAAALAGLGRPQGAVTMVGDRAHDVEGATACGIPCIGVTWGFGTRPELEGAGARVVVDTRPALAYAVVVGAA